MDVNSGSFPSEVLKIIQNIADSRFIAFDLEFSGVAGRRAAGGVGKLSTQEYYSDLRSAAQIYQILQVGLTVVTEDIENGRYEARPYNFYLSPLPATKESVFTRVWSYNSGATSFLLRNGFDMDKPFTQGVHYLSRQEEEHVRKKLEGDEQLRSKIPDMQPKDEDSVLIEYINKTVHDWQALPKDEQEPYINIPAEDTKDPIPSTLNRYQVRLTHQIVRNEYPDLKTQGMGHFVQVTNPTEQAQFNLTEVRAQKRELDISNAIGFRWILEAIIGGDISKLPHYYVVAAHPPEQAPKDVQAFLNGLQKKLKSQRRALVGHNCLTDVINLYRCFIGDLPEEVEDFRARLHELFPMVIDTKYIAGLGIKKYYDTSLRAVESDLCGIGVPRIHLPTNFDRYLYASNYHEAGFDSWVTAKIGLKVPGKLKREHPNIKALVEGSDPEDEQAHATERAKVVHESSQDKTNIQQGTTNGIVGMIKVGNTPESVVSKQESTPPLAKPLLVPASVMPTNGAVIATKEKVVAPTESKNELQKLKIISKKTNIFNLLKDEPEATSEEPAPVDEEQRISELVREGKLMPRWEEDAEFWRLISNKLQANATKDGIWDLTRR